MQTPDTTWSDLDKANAAHYESKCRPDFLALAMEQELTAIKEHNKWIDAYTDNPGATNHARMMLTERAVSNAQAWRVYCAECWQEGRQPVSTPQEIEAIVSAAMKR